MKNLGPETLTLFLPCCPTCWVFPAFSVLISYFQHLHFIKAKVVPYLLEDPPLFHLQRLRNKFLGRKKQHAGGTYQVRKHLWREMDSWCFGSRPFIRWKITSIKKWGRWVVIWPYSCSLHCHLWSLAVNIPSPGEGSLVCREFRDMQKVTHCKPAVTSSKHTCLKIHSENSKEKVVFYWKSG